MLQVIVSTHLNHQIGPRGVPCQRVTHTYPAHTAIEAATMAFQFAKHAENDSVAVHNAEGKMLVRFA